MGINTTVLIESIISVDMWISKLLESYGDTTNMGELLTMVITTEVLLTAQSLANRYK
jgi:hypothetical protein